jgi:hypothetical protein
MPFLTESQLRPSATLQKSAKFRSNIKTSGSSAEVTIFLSHSHKDRAIAEGLIERLAELGISLYVDWSDTEMPRVTNRTTADRIKVRIRESAWFMVLATNNAIASKWVPWETGIADQAKTERRVLVVPVADATGKFEGSEYLQLYPRIERSSMGLLEVLNPGASFSGVLLEKHLRAA